jgi:hypothetical protein
MFDRWARRSVYRVRREFRSRIDRYKLTGKADVRVALLADPSIAGAVRAHAAASGEGEEQAWDASAPTSTRSSRASACSPTTSSATGSRAC